MQNLSLETLPQYDQGSLAILFDQALRQIYLDLEDRPLLKKDRVLTLSIKLKPEADPQGELECVVSEMSVKCALPEKAANTNYLVPNRRDGAISFEPDTRRARFASDQTTIPFEEEGDQ